MYNVLIVEDSKISREAVENRLSISNKYEVKASIENAANAEIVCMSGSIDLILMDVCTADNESGLNAAKIIKKHSPQIKVIIMTSMPEYSFIHKAKEYDCDGFWYKEYGDTDLIDICDRVMSGGTFWPEETPLIEIGNIASKDFTSRELSVIKDLSKGLKYDQIAEDLGITTNTVKYHIKNVLQKTGYRNTLQLVADVVEKRLILPKY
jgi:DNA-binding NarL/FixJ family response regulator